MADSGKKITPFVEWLEVAPNLAVARAVYDDAGGWGPWTCAA